MMSFKDQLKKINKNLTTDPFVKEESVANKFDSKNSKSVSKLKNDHMENKIVYSDDPKDQEIISGQKQKNEFIKIQQDKINNNQFTVVFRIEKNGRGGKTVTVMDQFPADENYLKELTKELKSKCGVGGSYRLNNDVGVIEIQGDKRDSIKKLFELKKIKFKGV